MMIDDRNEKHDLSERGGSQRPRSLVIVVIGTVVLGIVIGGMGMWFITNKKTTTSMQADVANNVSVKAPEKKAPLYQCPMHPAITADHPSDCPICGMKLVLVEESVLETPKRERTAGTGSEIPGLVNVTIDPTRQQLIGLRTARVTKGPVGASWKTVARVQVDPTRVRQMNVKVDGFVERIFVDFVGQTVRKGQPLFSIYSPSLLSAQNEYLLALETKEALAKGGAASDNGNTLVAAARRRLELWDVPVGEIERLSQTRTPIKSLTMHSPIAGIVTAKNVVQGARVNLGEAPYEITDLGSVWVMADAYESDLSRIRIGMKATLTLPAYPSRSFPGKVAFIDPLLDPQTRTIKVHLHFDNPTRELKPGMFGEVALEGVTQTGLRIPADAVIRAGSKDIVFLAQGEGRFEPRVVILGSQNATEVEVVRGLEEGQEVVTRANFLVDSESQLRASLAAIGKKAP
jgi:Cu(I)/Ag(I) efflux system membrane fusion protein